MVVIQSLAPSLLQVAAVAVQSGVAQQTVQMVVLAVALGWKTTLVELLRRVKVVTVVMVACMRMQHRVAVAAVAAAGQA